MSEMMEPIYEYIVAYGDIASRFEDEVRLDKYIFPDIAEHRLFDFLTGLISSSVVLLYARNSGVLHRYEATESVCVPNIVFLPELLGTKTGRIYQKYIAPVIESAVPCIRFSPSVKWQQEILQRLLHIFRLTEKENSEMQIVSHLLELWQQLFIHSETHREHMTGDKGRRAQLQVMMQFIHANFNRQITLREIADSVHISESSALQLFRQGIHLSPVAYLIQYRLKRAADLLANTNKTVSNVAYETGFSDAGYFCRTFRKYYRQTAVEYRKSQIE